MTDIQKYVQFLQIHPPFNQVPVDLLEKIASVLQVHHYGVGQTIFRKGEEAMIFYIIRSGMVREIFQGAEGKETTISFLKSGECFGAVSMLTGQRRKVNAVVEEDVELYVIYKQDLERLLSEYSDLNMYFNRTLSQKLNMFFEYFEREKIKFLDKNKSADEKEKELAVINEITKLMSLDEDIEHKLLQVVTLLRERMNADACSLFLLDNLSDRLILKASSGFQVPENRTIEMKANEGITGWVVKNREPVNLENVGTDPRIKFISEIHEERFKSLLSIPLITGEETFGAINFQTIGQRKYNYEEIRGMTIAGGQIALVFYNAMLKKRFEADINILHMEKGAVPEEFAGKSLSIKKINKFIAKVADSNLPILLEGEKGTGKELLARLVHSSGARKNGPFVELDCDLFPQESWGGELFGMEEEGAGPSKIVQRGFVEKADGGILFLKNVEKLNSACQVKLFNFLESGFFNRVGSKTKNRVNVRIIGTSNVNLKTMVLSGSFNKNTFESLNGFSFKTETLRKMKRDIPELCNYLLKRIGRLINKEGLSLSESAERKLQAYNWPGNVSELENVLKGAAILSSGKTIEEETLFFPSRLPGDKPVYNLLRHTRLSNFLNKNTFPNLFGKAGLILFCLTIFLLLISPQNNILNSAVWSAGWFLIFLFTFLFGRIFCALCPFMMAGEEVRNWKSFNIKRPKIVSPQGKSIAFISIFIIFWMESIFDFLSAPYYTVMLLMSITLGALVCAVYYERRVWCRYFCPMGTLLGVFSLTSFLSIDTDKHVCMYRCDTHDCYTGNKGKPGCQLFLHPYGIESQRHCVLCMQCYKNCPYGSVKLNLQFPGTGILAVAEPSLIGALASTALLGILPVESGGLFAPGSALYEQFTKSLSIGVIPAYTMIFLCAAVMPSLTFLCIERFLGGHNFKKSVFRLTRLGYSLLPMALLGHISYYGKKMVTWMEMVILQVGSIQVDFFSANLVFYGIYATVILLGVAGSMHTFIRILRSDPAALPTSRKLTFGYTALIGLYTIIYLLTVV